MHKERRIDDGSLKNGNQGQRGVYTLIIEVHVQQKIKIGALGSREFKEGYYAYVGSAMGKGSSSLMRRIGRHLLREKKAFWHIDYLLKLGNRVDVVAVVGSFAGERKECSVAIALKEQAPQKALPMRGFGSSDCLGACGGHLFFFPGIKHLEEALEIVLDSHRKVGLNPIRIL
jgi:Uri superfamily endonuclease